jgi:protein SERAC1
MVAISGIGGHAFGSFRSPDGEYMWLRDKLPRHLPGARIMIYGYDSQIAGSKSFQGLGAISSTIKNNFRSVKRWSVSLLKDLCLLSLAI